MTKTRRKKKWTKVEVYSMPKGIISEVRINNKKLHRKDIMGKEIREILNSLYQDANAMAMFDPTIANFTITQAKAALCKVVVEAVPKWTPAHTYGSENAHDYRMWDNGFKQCESNTKATIKKLFGVEK